MTQSGYEVQDCCRTIFSCPLFLMYVVFMSGCFNFSKPVLRAPVPPTVISIFQKPVFAPQNRLRRFLFFKNQRFAPQKHLRRSQCFSKTGTSRLKTIYGGFDFSKVGASHLNTAYSSPNLFKNWRFALQKLCLLFAEKNTMKRRIQKS